MVSCVQGLNSRDPMSKSRKHKLYKQKRKVQTVTERTTSCYTAMRALHETLQMHAINIRTETYTMVDADMHQLGLELFKVAHQLDTFIKAKAQKGEV